MNNVSELSGINPDYIPIVSAVTNVVDLFHIFRPAPLEGRTEKDNRYYTYLSEKSILRCVALILLPLVGNIAFAVWDYLKTSDAIALALIRLSSANIFKVDPKFRTDEVFISQAIEANPFAITALPHVLQQKFALQAVAKDGLVIGSIQSPSEKLQQEALDQNPLALRVVAKQFQEDRETVLAAVGKNGMALEFAPKFKNDRKVCYRAVKQNRAALQFADPSIKPTIINWLADDDRQARLDDFCSRVGIRSVSIQ